MQHKIFEISTHEYNNIVLGRKIYANIVEDNYCSNIRIFDIFYLFSID